MTKYLYLAADGGPHLVLPDALRSQWAGVSASWAAGIPSETDDYARACAVTGDFGLISVGSGQALVLAESPAMTALPKAADESGIDVYILNGWNEMDLDALIDQAIAATPTTAMTDTGKDWGVDGGGLTMIFAGDKPGNVVYSEERVALAPATYRLYAGTYAPNAVDNVVICRLVRQTP